MYVSFLRSTVRLVRDDALPVGRGIGVRASITRAKLQMLLSTNVEDRGGYKQLSEEQCDARECRDRKRRPAG